MDATESLKRAAAEAGVNQIRSGMAVGLGTGSTARHAIELLGASVRAGSLRGIICVPTSRDTEARARAEGLTLSTLTAHPRLDLAIDGADEVDPQLDLIKGMGGAMREERRVAGAAKRFVVFVDERKRVPRLGVRSPVPVEVMPEHAEEMLPWLERLGGRPIPRGAGAYRTDGGNAVLDCHFPGGIPSPAQVAEILEAERRVISHGLFLGMADQVLVATAQGVESLDRRR